MTGRMSPPSPTVEAVEAGENQQARNGSGAGLGTGHDGSSPFRLRPYQILARDAVLGEWTVGRLSTLLAMATGCGKTEVFLAVLDAERDAGRLTSALVVSHRGELVDQPAERIARHFPALQPVGIVQADRNELGARVTCATIQTLTHPSRLEQLLQHRSISHVIVDEAHHSRAPSYLRLIDALRGAHPPLRVLGATATPRGGSGKHGLYDVFESVAFRFSLDDAIACGAAVPFRAFGVTLPVSFAGVAVRAGDYDEAQAGSVLSARNALALVVDSYGHRGEGRPALAFTASVAHAHALAEAFRSAGVPAAAIDGTTSSEERRIVLAAFRRGELRVLSNCAVFGEGVDLPFVSCLLQVKPTRSDAAYLQMVGRGFRPFPEKPDLLLFDFIPRDARDLTLAGDLLGTPRPDEPAAAPPDERAERESFAVLPDGRVDADPATLQVRMLEYLRADPLAWTTDNTLATVSLGPNMILAVHVLPTGAYALYQIADWQATALGAIPAWTDVVAQVRARFVCEGDPCLAERRRRWRREPATPKQVSRLVKWGRWTPGLTKGEAAQRITHEVARRVLVRTLRDQLPAAEFARPLSPTPRTSPRDYVMRAPCPGCGASSGMLRDRNGQATVRCARCGRFCYNAPKSEMMR
jgi:superfamily II DNA or RNA helicase